jgi:teichoic acid transport system ATP-binding protein
MLLTTNAPTINGDSNTKVPKYAFLTITGENSKKYRVNIDNQDYVHIKLLG